MTQRDEQAHVSYDEQPQVGYYEQPQYSHPTYAQPTYNRPRVSTRYDRQPVRQTRYAVVQPRPAQSSWQIQGSFRC